jgi:serine phosphatase RsbU (regulator of sigma subunit)
MPKDKVSGDFYWWAEVENQIIITVADCTGHGVPGAFMTMLGTSFLREIVQKEYITDAALILKKLRKEIIKALKQKGVQGEQKDGMDMALVSYNKENNILNYAGAHNSLIIIRNSSNLESELETITEIKADKMPISIYEKLNNFTNHEIQINSGDTIYLFSDGYVDQFGGPNGKKFLSKNLKSLFTNIKNKNMNEQKEILLSTIEDWKNNYGSIYEQIDDITIMGIKI